MQNSKLQFKIKNLSPKLKTFNFSLFTFHLQAGQSLVEIILAIGLSAIILPALLVGLVSSREGRAQQSQRTQATYLLNETVDAVRSVREKGWTSFAVNGTYHPVVSGSGWSLATGSATVNGFTQSITVGDINRDSNGVIVSSDGILDPSTKKVDVLITWGQPYLSKIDTTLFITRYLDNNAFVQTTVGDFNLGTKSGTIITDTSGGEVTLGAGGRGNWCAPNLSIAALDLPKNGVANALTVIEGRAFAGTGNNASGVSFANIPITTTYPPVASIAGTLSGYKTNGIFGESDYAYITTDNNFKEMVIIDLTNLIGDTYSEVGYFDAPGNNSGRSVYVIDNIGYVTVDNILYSVNLSAKNGSRPYLDSVSLVGNGTKVFVVGDYAYVATSSTGTQLQIIDVSNPNDMVVVGQSSVDGNSGVDVVVNSSATRAYLATAASVAQREFFIIDVSIKTGNRPVVGSYEAQGMNPKGTTVVTNNKAILVGTGGEEYQAIDIANESGPVRCGGLSIDTGVNGVSSIIQSNGDVFSYIITGDSGSELKIIEGGPGGSYVSSGDFVSSIFDTGYSTAFNRFDVSVNNPNSTNISFQIAVSEEMGGNCSGSSFNFVGPDATPATFFTTNVTSGIQVFSFPIPPNINPGRCFKYKTFFSTMDPTANPIFYDIVVNYSP